MGTIKQLTGTLMGHSSKSAAPSGSGLALLVIAAAQLMLVLDDSIANIALPSIQRQFGVSSVALPWVVNAYVLAFGGLLLLGGRVGDLFGRLKTFRGAWAYLSSLLLRAASHGMSSRSSQREGFKAWEPRLRLPTGSR